MSSSIPPPDPRSEPAAPQDSAAISSDDLLPPVEPPSAKFIIQLFVVPAVIVAVVVLLWVTINWLASPGRQDPEAIVRGLRSSSQARFQQAEELASMLRMDESYPELKGSRELAAGLSTLLNDQVDVAASNPDDDHESAIRMRMFLCASLGEFHVDDPLEALVRTARRDPDGHVRRSAMGAVAVLAGWFAAQDPPEPVRHAELLEVFASLADSEDALDRSAAAFTLGVLAAAPDADPGLIELLANLADDFFPDARYNAAVGLARAGDARAADVLSEMLDLEHIGASVASEQAVNSQLPGPEPPERVVQALRAEKRDALIKNGLVGVERLLRRHRPEDLPQVRAALVKLSVEAADVHDPGPIPESLQGAIRQMADRFE